MQMQPFQFTLRLHRGRQVDPPVATVAFSLKCSSSPLSAWKKKKKKSAEMSRSLELFVCACVFINVVNFYRRGLEEAHLQDNTLDFCIPTLLTSGLAIVCLLRSRRWTEHVKGGRVMWLFSFFFFRGGREGGAAEV